MRASAHKYQGLASWICKNVQEVTQKGGILQELGNSSKFRTPIAESVTTRESQCQAGFVLFRQNFV